MNEARQRCLNAFVRHDYDTCVDLSAAEIEQGATLDLLQALVISLQRTGRTESLSSIGPQFLAATAGNPWENGLLRLTLGQTELSGILAFAGSDVQRCQAHYYAGARLLTVGQVDAARAEFGACMALEANCTELDLARCELESPPPSPAADASPIQQETDRLSRVVVQLVQQGRYQEALQPAQQAFDLSRQHFGENHAHCAAAMNNLAAVYQKMGRYAEAAPLYEQTTEIDRVARGEHHPDYATSLNNLASLYEAMGSYAKAASVHRQALQIRRDVLGDDHPEYAQSLNNLALVYRAIGDYREAESLFRQSMRIRRRALGENHPDYATSLNNLADASHLVGKYKESESLSMQAARIWRATLGENHPHYAASLNHLASVYDTMGEYAKAETVCREAMEILRRSVGDTHPLYAASLMSVATACRNIGKYMEAESLYEQALQITAASLGDDHPKYAVGLHDLAGLYRSTGDFAKAEQLLKRALQIKKTALGEKHREYGDTLGLLGLIYMATSDYARAQPLLQQAVEITRETLGEHHPAYARSLNNVAGLYKSTGDYAKAEPLFRRALEINKASLGECHPATANSLQNLGLLYARSNGDYEEAQSLLQQAIEIDGKAYGESHPSYAGKLHNLAEMHRALGDFTEAEPLYRQALDILQNSLGKDHPERAAVLANVAELNRDLGNYAEAELLGQQALDIWRRAVGKKHPDYATGLNNLAQLYGEMGDYAKAESLSQEAIEISRASLGENHPSCATSLSNLATLYQKMGRFAQAERLYRDAILIKRDALGDNHPSHAGSLNNLATMYLATHHYAQAEPLLQQALHMRLACLGDEHADYAGSLVALAVYCQGVGDYLRAEPLLEQATDIIGNTLSTLHPSYGACLVNLAFVRVATNQTSDALPLMERAMAIDDRIIGEIFSIGSETQRMAYLGTIQAKFESFLSLVLEHLQDTHGGVNAAFELILRRKAIGAEAIAAQRDVVMGGKYGELKARLRQLTALRLRVAKKRLVGPGPDGPQEHERLLAKWNSEKDRLEAELARQIPEMNLEQQLRAADRRAVALGLPEGVALVEFVRFDVFDFHAVAEKVSDSRWRAPQQWKPARYLAFVLPAGEPDNVQMIDLGEAEPIDRMIADFRAGITGQTEHGAGRDLGAAPGEGTDGREREIGSPLRAAVFDKLTDALGGRNRLLLSPDGDLTRLPFEALPSADGRRLIDDYHFSYVAVGRDVLRFGAESSGSPTDPLIVADPDFDLASTAEGVSPDLDPRESSQVAMGRHSRDLSHERGIHFGRLPGTRAEGEHIAEMLKVQPWLEADALEARLKAYGSPRILHVATHGFFLEDQKRDPNKEMRDLGALEALSDGPGKLTGAGIENPLLRSGLALSGANTWLSDGQLPPDAEDGILTAEDVSGLDLLATELVVLSACETGLGEIRTGEGVFGLRRAFVLAGAKTLVMSLWKVPDQQTQELMEEFYRRILAGEPRAEALRQAQLAMKATYPDPLYWGAFICQGEPGPLRPG